MHVYGGVNIDAYDYGNGADLDYKSDSDGSEDDPGAIHDSAGFGDDGDGTVDYDEWVATRAEAETVFPTYHDAEGNAASRDEAES